MSKSAIAAAIRGRFAAQVQTTAEAAGFSVFYDNDGQETAGETKRCRCYIDDMPDEIIGLSNPGNALYRVENGICKVDVYVAANDGEDAQWALVDTIETAFRGISLASPDIVFRGISTSKATKAGARWRRTVTIRFRADFRA